MANLISRPFDINAIATPGAKKVQSWLANLGTFGVFPYFQDGQIVWHYKPPEYYLSDEFIDQHRLAIITDGHPDDFSSSAEKSVGLVQEAWRSDPFISGRVALFSPKVLERICDNGSQLSPGIVADLVPCDREFMGVRCSFIQQNPMLDHVALEKKGRQGENVSLQTIIDRCNCQKAFIEVLPMREQVTLAQVDEKDSAQETSQVFTVSGNVADAPEVAELTTRLGEMAEQNRLLLEEVGALKEAASQSGATENQDLTTKIADAALKAIAIQDCADALNIEASISEIVRDPVKVLRLVVSALNPGVEIADKDLFAFAQGVLSARKSNTTATQVADSGKGLSPSLAQIVNQSDLNSRTHVDDPMAKLNNFDRGLFAQGLN